MSTTTPLAQGQQTACIWDVKQQSIGNIADRLRPVNAQTSGKLKVTFSNSKRAEADVIYKVYFEHHRWQVRILHRRSIFHFFESYRAKQAIEIALFERWKPLPYREAAADYSYCSFFQGRTKKTDSTLPICQLNSSHSPKVNATATVLTAINPILNNDTDDEDEEDEFVSITATPAVTSPSIPLIDNAVMNDKTCIPFCKHYAAIEKWVSEENLQHCKVSRRIEIEEQHLLNAMQQIRQHDLPTSNHNVIIAPVTLQRHGWLRKNHAVLAIIAKERTFIVDSKPNIYQFPLYSLSTSFQSIFNDTDCTRHALYTLKCLLPKIEHHFDDEQTLTGHDLYTYLKQIEKKNPQELDRLLNQESE